VSHAKIDFFNGKISIVLDNTWSYSWLYSHCFRLLPRGARCYAERGYATVCRTVRLSVTFRYRDNLGWNSSKIISRMNSLKPMRGLTPTWGSGATGTPPKLGWNRGGVTQEHKKPAISPKRWKIGTGLL